MYANCNSGRDLTHLPLNDTTAITGLLDSDESAHDHRERLRKPKSRTDCDEVYAAAEMGARRLTALEQKIHQAALASHDKVESNTVA